MIVIQTSGYAGGGFDPYLSLFDGSGLQFLLDSNDDGGCGNVGADPNTHACLDSFLSILLAPGTYLVALTESGNAPLGPALSDGFLMDGAGDFTGGPFLDAQGNQRNGQWALQIDGADAASTPEPGTAALMFAGLVVSGRLFRKIR